MNLDEMERKSEKKRKTIKGMKRIKVSLNTHELFVLINSETFCKIFYKNLD